jgi:hypothetical protein
LFVISLADRVVQLADITAHPNEAWMMQVGRGTDASAFLLSISASDYDEKAMTEGGA